MSNAKSKETESYCRPVELTDEDVHDAMKEIPGYLDITTGDFKEIYRLAYRHAVERLAGSIAAREIMVREVVSVGRKTPLRQVAETMADHGISGVPVIEGDKVAGMISEKDFLTRMGDQETRNFMAVIAQCLKGKGCVALPIRGQNAEDIMTSPAITVRADTSIVEVANILMQKNINRVPVVDEKGKLLGIVSRTDIVSRQI